MEMGFMLMNGLVLKSNPRQLNKLWGKVFLIKAVNG